MSITLACCSISFREDPIESVIKHYAQIGYDAIEILGRQIERNTPESIRDLRKLADDLGIGVLAVSPYFILTRSRQHFDETMEIAKWSVQTAQTLGATKIRTFTDVGDGIGSDHATQQHWDQAVEGLKRICAMDRKIQFVVETHPRTLADTVDSIEKLLKLVNEPNLKLNFQPTPEFISFGLLRAYDRLQKSITHMHLQQISSANPHGTWMEEPGDVDFPAFISHLKKTGYDQSISVEYCWKDVPRERVESAHTYLRGLLK